MSSSTFCSPKIYAQDIVPLPRYKTYRQDSLFYGLTNDLIQGKKDIDIRKAEELYRLKPNDPAVSSLLSNIYSARRQNEKNELLNRDYGEKSMKYAEIAYRQNPSNKEYVSRYYGMLLISNDADRQNKLDEVIESIYQLYPDNSYFALERAKSLVLKNYKDGFKEAMSILDKIANKNTNRDELLNIISYYKTLDTEKKHKKEVESRIRSIYEQHSEDNDFINEYLNTLYSYQDHKECLKVIKKALKDSDDPNIYKTLLPVIYSEMKDHKKMMKSLYDLIGDTAITNKERCVLISDITQRLSLLTDKDKDDIVSALYNEYPKDQDVIFFYTNDLMNKGKNEEALSLLNEHASEISPEKKKEFITLAMDASEQSDNIDGVIALADKAIKDYPHYGMFYFRKALALAIQKREKEALDTIMLGLKQLKDEEDEENEGSYNILCSLAGDIYSQLGEIDKAEKYYQLAYDSDESDPDFLNNYAYFLAENDRDLPRALEMIQQAIDMDADDYNMLDTEATILIKLKKFTQAADIMQRVIENTENPSVTNYLHYAQALDGKGDFDKATRIWMNVLNFANTTPTEKNLKLLDEAKKHVNSDYIESLIKKQPDKLGLYEALLFVKTTPALNPELEQDSDKVMKECVEIAKKIDRLDNKDEYPSLLIEMLLNNKEYDEAISLTDQKIKKNPVLYKLLTPGKAIALLLKNNTEEAAETITKYLVSTDSPDKRAVEAFLQIMGKLKDEGKKDIFRKLFDKVLTAHPKDEALNTAYIELLIGMSDYDDIVRHIESLQKIIGKNNPKCQTMLFETAAYFKKDDAAIKEFQKLTRLERNPQKIFEILGETENKYRSLIMNTDFYIKLGKIYSDAYPNEMISTALYSGFLQMKDNDKAISFLKDCLKKAPEHNRGYIYWELMKIYSQQTPPDLDQIIETALKAEKEHVANQEIYSMLIGAYFTDGKTDKALDKINEVIADSEAMGKNAEFLSEMYGMKGDILSESDTKQAIKCYEKAFELNPQNINFQNNYAYFLAKTDQKLEFALSLIKRLNSGINPNPVTIDTEAYVLYKLKRYDEAKELEEKAIKLSLESEYQYLDFMGDIQLASGNRKEAVAYWNKAVELLKKRHEDEKAKEIEQKIQKHSQSPK